MTHGRFLLLTTEMHGTVLDRLRLVDTAGQDLVKALESVRYVPQGVDEAANFADT